MSQESYQPLLDLIRNASRVQGKPLLIALDGYSGAGKSSLAAQLHRIFPSNLFTMDDFFLQPWQRTPERLATPGGNVDYERFLQEVLIPLKHEVSFTYRPFDCSTLAMGAEVAVQPQGINIIEGVYTLHPELRDYYDIKVFLNLGEDEQKRRLQSRNPALYPRFLTEWLPMERLYFTA
ncbi:MAG: uridine kinase, partial [Symbiobacteriaceae bacterium]|nr:uridine kinase [Symbiobacteriaceae bacterium]